MKKWCIVFANRPLHNNNKHKFFSELSNSLNRITNKYDNFTVTGDLNINILDNTKDHYNYLSNLSDTFSLNNLINGKTCFKADASTSVGVMLTNKPRSFHRTSIIETGCSYHHNMTLSFVRTHF